MIEENKHAPCSSPTSGLTLDIRSAPGLLDQIPVTPEYDSPHKVQVQSLLWYLEFLNAALSHYLLVQRFYNFGDNLLRLTYICVRKQFGFKTD